MISPLTKLLPALAALALLTIGCSGGDSRPEWICEDESGCAGILRHGDTLEITAPKGVTLWYSRPLKGSYRITYEATVLMQGGAYDRLSDLNCFWGATDPGNKADFFARSSWRGGKFARYNTLNLFYVGYGGNHNTTTRFRRYHGDRYGAPDEEVKPLIAQYTDSLHLLRPNRAVRIEIEVADGRTTYSANGEPLFTQRLAPGEGEGYFGLRLLRNHTRIVHFRIETQ